MQSIFRSARAGLLSKWSLVALCAVVVALAPAAGAYPLAGSVSLPDMTTVVPGVSTSDGTMIASMVDPWSFTTTAGTTSGTLTTAVFRETSGTLDFYYQVMNNASSATSIGRESNTNFDSFQTSASTIVNGSTIPGGLFVDGTVSPDFADRLSGVVGFFSLNPATRISPGSTSVIYVISTNATNFTAGNAELLDGGSVTVAAFQPAGNVPEPTTMVMLGGGLLALAGIRRYRR